MKQKLLIPVGVAALLLISYQAMAFFQGTPGTSQNASVIDAFDSSVVGYWPLNDGNGSTVADLSVTRDNGAFIGTPIWTAGNVGNGAAQFNGSNYLSIPDNAALHFGTSTPFSVSLWVKTTVPNGTFITTFPYASRGEGYSITYGTHGVTVDLRLYSPTTNDINDCVIGGNTAGTSTIADGRWHHVAIVVNRTSTCTTNDIFTYVDHAQQPTTVSQDYHATTNQSVSGFSPMVIGGVNNYNTLSGAYVGAIDDVRVFKRALSASDVIQLYNLGAVGASLCSGNSCTAKSCSLSDVQTAVDSVNDGDTVIVPAGKCVWTGNLSLTKTIILQGAGSTAGGTEIDYGGTGHTLIYINPGSKRGKMDISGFLFYGGDKSFWDGSAIQMYGPIGWKNLRIHNNTFSNNTQYSITGNAATDALIDSNYFEGTSSSGIVFQGQGENDWNRPLVLGTDDFTFVENNTFSWTDNQGGEGHVTFDFNNGGRIVFRYNHVINGLLETHDRARGGYPSANAFEFYGNTFTANSSKWEGINTSSGSGVVWGNTFVGPFQIPIGGLDYKSFDTHDNWNDGTLPCNGYDPLDQNTPQHTVIRCQYQLGSQGEGATEYSVPAYYWNNTYLGTSTPFQVTDASSVHLIAGRDYINGAQKPGYAPYPYPHPLTGMPSITQNPTLPVTITTPPVTVVTPPVTVVATSAPITVTPPVTVTTPPVTVTTPPTTVTTGTPPVTITTPPVTVVTPPVPVSANPQVYLNHSELNPMHIPLNANFAQLDPGAYAVAARHNDWTSGVRRDGGNINSGWDIDSSKPGTYTITYTIREFDGADTSKVIGSATVSRTVIVDPGLVSDDISVVSMLANIWDAVLSWWNNN